MKSIVDRNPVVVGAIGCAVTAAIVLGALNYDKLPFIDSDEEYSAYFAEAGGLASGAAVQASGMRVGQVTSVTLDKARVRVEFTVADAIHLGDKTEATIKTKTLLGAKFLEVAPRGNGKQSGAIPLDRTTSPYQLADALGDLTTTISGLNTEELSTSLATISDTFSQTPPDLKIAVQGVARFSDTLNQRDQQLRSFLSDASKATGVLARRSDQVVGLVADANGLLAQLEGQSSALDQISGRISAVSRQVEGLIAENRQSFKPMLDKLNGVLTIVDNRKERVQKSVKLLNQYAMSLGESVSSGPFFNAYLVNLLPGQFVQPFIDAAFSDLGVDPNTMAPSQLSDPQVGTPGIPPLPLPYPRTGQGGEPKRTLPDAITGKPGDPRYPYREPLPAPAPGGPPPGPPALPSPGQGSGGLPTQSPILVPAPHEVPPATGGRP